MDSKTVALIAAVTATLWLASSGFRWRVKAGLAVAGVVAAIVAVLITHQPGP